MKNLKVKNIIGQNKKDAPYANLPQYILGCEKRRDDDNF